MNVGAFLHITGKKIVRIAVDKILRADYNNRIHRRAILSVKKRPVSFPEAGCFVGYKGEWRICMFIVYFALWVILNGKWTTEIGIFGVIFAAALYAFSCRFMGYGFKKDLHYLRRLPTTICYGATLLAEIFKANVTVMKMILDKNFEPQPQLVHFESGLKETRHRVALADSITLTPGTITCQLEGDHYLVHCLDAAMVDGLDNGVFVEKLSQMEQKQEFMADSVTGEVQPENEAAEAETQATATVNEAAENEAPENDGDAEKEEEHEH